MAISKSIIVEGLKDLGLPRGAVTLVHSSLSKFGYVDGGPKTVIDALLETIGTEGTLVMPTLTGNEALSMDTPPFFDTVHSKSWTGVIPETFRYYPGALRSLHPTHSVAALGPMADFLIRDHLHSITPCDGMSPYGRLAKLEQGYILLLGVDHESNTMLHHVEERVGVEYHMQPGFVHATVIDKGIKQNVSIMIHKYGAARQFNCLDFLFVERGIQVTGKIGNATVRLVQVKSMVEIAYKCLIADRRVFLRDKESNI